MEWGTFITVIVAAYLAWFGLNFLFDLFIGARPKLQTEESIHYNIGDLTSDEEAPHQVSGKDYEEPAVKTHHTPENSKPTDSDLHDGGVGQSIQPRPIPTPVEPAPIEPAYADDWASVLDREEEVINIPVQGRPVPLADFLQSLREQAKAEASSITF